MTIRASLNRAARGAYLAFSRGTLTKANDKPRMQELTVEGLNGEKYEGLEHWHGYGFTHRPLPPTQGQKDGKDAEVLFAFMGGARSHPIIIAVADRRHRPRDLKEGESQTYDDQKQRVYIKRDMLWIASPLKVYITAGEDGKEPKAAITLTPDGKILIEAAEEIEHKSKNIYLTAEEKIYLGGRDAKRELSLKDTIDTDGDLEVGNLATKIVGK